MERSQGVGVVTGDQAEAWFVLKINTAASIWGRAGDQHCCICLGKGVKMEGGDGRREWQAAVAGRSSRQQWPVLRGHWHTPL